MIVDTSALVAVVFDEPERAEFMEKIGVAGTVGVGAPTLVETGLVLAGALGELGRDQLGRLVQSAELVVVPFDATHWQAAMDAWLRFGRGRHPAALNLGDCLSYATARIASRPLLCKGDDFARTDLVLA